MTQLWLIRHAQTDANAAGIMQGQYDAELSALGREQARRLAQRIIKSPPDVIYSSDLSRAHETARAVSQMCELPIHLDARLREIDLGLWSNRPWKEIRRLFPAELERSNSDPTVRRGVHGENAREVQERVVAAINEILAKHQEQRIAVFSHGFALRTYIAHLLEIPLIGIHNRLKFGNTGITRIRFSEDSTSARLISLNDTYHLGEPL